MQNRTARGKSPAKLSKGDGRRKGWTPIGRKMTFRLTPSVRQKLQMIAKQLHEYAPLLGPQPVGRHIRVQTAICTCIETAYQHTIGKGITPIKFFGDDALDLMPRTSSGPPLLRLIPGGASSRPDKPTAVIPPQAG